MNWTHIILAGYVGAVIAMLVALMRKKGWVSKAGAVALALAAIVVWNVVDVHYFMPRQDAQQTEAQKFDAAFEKLPIYSVLNEQDPQFMAHLRDRALAMRKEGKPEQQIIDAIQPEIMSLQIKRLQAAPDANVVAFMQANMQQTALMQKQSDDACFRFLFPEVKGGVNAARLLPQDVTRHRMEVDAEMMRAAWGANKHTVTDAERQRAQQDVQPILQKLTDHYGSDFSLMATPQQAVGKEQQVCNIVQDLWRQVLQLPDDRAAGIIRLSMEMTGQ
ncbi:topoisomerase II [Enterobacteriaceae bacterium]